MNARRRARERGWRLEAAILAAILAVAFAAWWTFLRPQPRYNVVLISIDSLRWDHVGAYGYAKPTTPNLDALAARGARFEIAHSSTSWTLPAHMTLMTGLPDDLHGVVIDAMPLDPHRHMLAERFRQAGYATGGVFGGLYLLPRFGFDRGFDSYENCGVPVPGGVPTVQTELDGHRIRTAPKTEEAAEAFLDGVGERPFFLFQHHWDVHYDYITPESYVKLFAPDYRGTLDLRNFYFNPAIHEGMAPEDLDYVKACYDAEIRFVDDHVGRLWKKLEELGHADDTFIVVVSDHGEEFFEHGNKGHRLNLHEETLRIPFLIAGPGIAPGTVISDPVRLMDVMPTLLDLAGLPPERECVGVSLRPLLKGTPDSAAHDLPLFAELTLVPKVSDPDGGMREADEFEKHLAIGRAGHKLIQSQRRAYDPRHAPLDFQGKLLETRPDLFYDLRNDPHERKELDSSEAPWSQDLLRFRKRLLDLMLAHLGTLPTVANPDPLPKDAEIEKLKAEIGY